MVSRSECDRIVHAEFATHRRSAMLERTSHRKQRSSSALIDCATEPRSREHLRMRRSMRSTLLTTAATSVRATALLSQKFELPEKRNVPASISVTGLGTAASSQMQLTPLPTCMAEVQQQAQWSQSSQRPWRISSQSRRSLPRPEESVSPAPRPRDIQSPHYLR
jgi:hypothetical protein